MARFDLIWQAHLATPWLWWEGGASCTDSATKIFGTAIESFCILWPSQLRIEILTAEDGPARWWHKTGLATTLKNAPYNTWAVVVITIIISPWLVTLWTHTRNPGCGWTLFWAVDLKLIRNKCVCFFLCWMCIQFIYYILINQYTLFYSFIKIGQCNL